MIKDYDRYLRLWDICVHGLDGHVRDLPEFVQKIEERCQHRVQYSGMEGKYGFCGPPTPPLSKAVENGHVAVLEVLIAAKAYVNVGDEYEGTPVFIAVKKGHSTALQVLIGAKSDVNG